MTLDLVLKPRSTIKTWSRNILKFQLPRINIFSHLVKSVHVQLSNEGGHVRVLVVVGQQRLGEFGLKQNKNLI